MELLQLDRTDIRVAPYLACTGSAPSGRIFSIAAAPGSRRARASLSLDVMDVGGDELPPLAALDSAVPYLYSATVQ